MHHETEELRVHHRATIPAGDARAVVVTLLASGRVPPLQATLLDLEDAAARPGLQRFWGTACLRDEVVYLILFINERCLVLALCARERPVVSGDQLTGTRSRWGVPEEATMNESVLEFTEQVLRPAMHEKILLRAAELVAMGWTCGTAARDANGQKVRSTAPQATAWCVVGAVDRALYDLWTLDVYALLGLEVDTYDTAPCSLAVQRALRRPLQRVLGCPGPAAAEQLLREAAVTAEGSVNGEAL